MRPLLHLHRTLLGLAVGILRWDGMEVRSQHDVLQKVDAIGIEQLLIVALSL
jgi:hypothetical protein